MLPIHWVICGGSSQYKNWPPQIDFPKGLYILLNKLSNARFKIKMQHVCFYMNVSLKRTDHLQKSFDVKVAFVNPQHLFEQHLLLVENLQVCGKHWCLSANINKKHVWELFWAMYYYYELGYYYDLSCTLQSLTQTLFYEIKLKNEKKLIGIIYQLPWFLNIGIGHRKTHIGPPQEEEYCYYYWYL